MIPQSIKDRDRPIWVPSRLWAAACLSVFIGCSLGTSDDESDQDSGSSPDYRYLVDHGWPSLPEGRILGFAYAVEVDSHGHVFTLHSFVEWTVPFVEQPETEPLVLMWNENGEFLTSWGAGGFLMPHGLSIDAADNVWITDVGRNQVFKFSHDGEELMVLGESGVEGWDETHFGQPSDVAFGPDGSIYVSDGYVNCRIVNFTSGGRFQFEWGECGSATSQFDIPHGLVIDSSGRVYVADRENDRIQVFESNGDFIAEWPSLGEWRPLDLSISPTGGEIFVIDGGENTGFPDRSKVVILDMAGRQLSEFGRFGNQDGQFMVGHDIAVTPDGHVYVVDIIGRRLQRFSRPN